MCSREMVWPRIKNKQTTPPPSGSVETSRVRRRPISTSRRVPLTLQTSGQFHGEQNVGQFRASVRPAGRVAVVQVDVVEMHFLVAPCDQTRRARQNVSKVVFGTFTGQNGCANNVLRTGFVGTRFPQIRREVVA